MDCFAGKRFSCILAFRLLLFCFLPASGPFLLGQTTIHVPGDQPAIQSAINAATNGDTVLVADGTYKENINFNGKAITVTSVNGPATTIINGSSTNTVVTFLTQEGPGSVLNGFTITNGSPNSSNATSNGGGILIGNASPTITNNLIVNNQGCAGVGIFISGGAALIQGNMISNNTESACGGVGGGGIAVQGPSNPSILGNVIANNTAGLGGAITLFASASSTPVLIENNIITGNNGGDQGGGIWMVNESPALIIQNLFIHNQAGEGGAIFSSASGSGMVVLNNTIADNPSPEGSGLYGEFPSDAIIQNNLVIGSAGSSAVFCDLGIFPPAGFIANIIFTTGDMAVDSSCTSPLGANGNTSVDPLFVAATADNYHIQAGSPAIGAGNTALPAALPATDLSGNPRIVNGKLDIGAFAFSTSVAGFSLGASEGVTSATVSPGQAASYKLVVTGTAGFSGTVSFACSGLPSGAMCSFSPASVFVNGAAGKNVVLTIQTSSGAETLPALRSLPKLPLRIPVGLLSLLSVVGTLTALLARRISRPMIVMASLAVVVLSTACGGGGANSSPGGGGQNGTPSGTSTVVVTAASGTTMQTFSLTLQVN